MKSRQATVFLIAVLFCAGRSPAQAVREDAASISTTVADELLLTPKLPLRVWFQNPNRGGGGFGSFHSGNTVAAFSVATLFAELDRTHHWLPCAAYGLTGVVGLSRLNVQAHFPSDVFLGAALGYSISHFAVLRKLITRQP